MRSARAFVLALALVAGGCRDVYEIEVTPDGEGFLRRLTCWHEDSDPEEEKAPSPSPLSTEKLGKLAEIYGGPETPEGEAKQVFAGRFTDAIPADVGGAGTYLHFTSPLGATWSYVERLPAAGDLEAELAAGRQAVSGLVDHVLGWFRMELGQEPGFGQLATFLDQDFRHDMVNLALLARLAEDRGEGLLDDDSLAALVRHGQYLRERGYLSVGDVPALIPSIARDDRRPLLAIVRRLVAEKLGGADPRLDFLSDREAVAASWSRYVETTAAYRQRRERWAAEQAADPGGDPPTAGDVSQELVEGAASAFLDFDLGASGSLSLRLHSGSQPYGTNGLWDPERKTVGWSADLDERSALAPVLFALWSTPDGEAQAARFGRVILQGKELAEYVLVYQDLAADERQVWDRFLGGLNPGDDLRSAFEAFRGPPEPREAGEAAARPSRALRRLIAQALDGDG